MKRLSWLAAPIAAGLLMPCAAPALAAAVTIDGTSSVYNYGSETAGAGSTAPTLVALAAGVGRTVRFTSVTGMVTLSPGDAPSFGPHDADGSPPDFDMEVTGAAGLSGVRSANVGYLTGVFLNGLGAPIGSPPATLDFRPGGLGEAFSSLGPLLNQLFFIGDGLTGTGSGALQTFLIPDDATVLALGFADAEGYAGPPGGYFDNSGSLSATVQVEAPPPSIPEPAVWSLMIMGFSAVGAVLRRRAPVLSRA